MKGIQGYAEGHLGDDVESRTFEGEKGTFTKLSARVAVYMGKNRDGSEIPSVWLSVSLPNWESLRGGKKGQKIRIVGRLIEKEQPDGKVWRDFEAQDADLFPLREEQQVQGGGIGTSPKRAGKPHF